MDKIPLENENISQSKIDISPDIIIKIKNGNHNAFEKVFKIFYPKVKVFIKMIIKADDIAEELTQQVFINLWINREKIDSQKNLSAYIYTIAKNSALTTLKKETRYEEISEEHYNQMIDNNMSDDILIAKETALLIKLAVANMPPKRREVYKMSRSQNKSNEEIANELKISRKVVEKHLRLALNYLKKVIQIVLLFFLL